jgi:magnesium transporter
MRLADLLGPDLKATLSTDPEEIREALGEFHPEDIAEILGDVPVEDAVALIRVLPDDSAADVLERLGPERQVEVLHALGAAEAAPLLGEMSADDRVDLVQELPDELAAEILEKLEAEEPEAFEEIIELRGYEEDTAGGLMTPEFVALPPDKKVWEAIEELRRVGREDAETIYVIYVLGYGHKLLGVVSLRDLILAEPGQTLADVMTENVLRAHPNDDQERVAEMMARYDLSTLPVVDDHGRMLGVVTVDDVFDVVIEEATEDAQMMGGVVPLEDSYFQTGFWTFIRARAAWLIVLFLGQLLTANVMERHAVTLDTMTGLVLFIPLIIATGGNSGAQSSTLIIRALALGEVTPRDWWRILVREMGIGVALGLVLGIIGFFRAWLFEESAERLATTVATSIVAIVTMGTLMGSLLPLGIKRLGMDPAVSSTPFIASLVDVFGLLLYFGVANLVLSLTL